MTIESNVKNISKYKKWIIIGGVVASIVIVIILVLIFTVFNKSSTPSGGGGSTPTPSGGGGSTPGGSTPTPRGSTPTPGLPPDPSDPPLIRSYLLELPIAGEGFQGLSVCINNIGDLIGYTTLKDGYMIKFDGSDWDIGSRFVINGREKANNIVMNNNATIVVVGYTVGDIEVYRKSSSDEFKWTKVQSISTTNGVKSNTMVLSKNGSVLAFMTGYYYADNAEVYYRENISSNFTKKHTFVINIGQSTIYPTISLNASGNIMSILSTKLEVYTFTNKMSDYTKVQINNTVSPPPNGNSSPIVPAPTCTGTPGIGWWPTKTGQRLVIVGHANDFSSSPTMAYSNDNGNTWTSVSPSPFQNSSNSLYRVGYSVLWNGSKWVAVGDGANTIAHSNDGINWTSVTGKNIFSDGYGIGWNGSKWVALGRGTNTIAYSTDGISWTGVGKVVFNQGRDVASDGTKWIAVGIGTNSMAYSCDSINWTVIESSPYNEGLSIDWNGSKWITSGSSPKYGSGITSPIAYSSDGVNWSYASINDSLTINCEQIAWNGSIWVAVGRGKTSIAYSTDGINWTGVASVLQAGANGITWNGTKWFAIGSIGDGRSSIAYSTNGIDWTTLNQNIFSYNINGIASN